VNGRRGERGGQDQPDRPEDGSEADRDDEDDERVQVERRSEGDRLDDVLEQPVGADDDHEHDQCVLRSLRREREEHGERAGDEGADRSYSVR
jgi:hypothetical protein